MYQGTDDNFQLFKSSYVAGGGGVDRYKKILCIDNSKLLTGVFVYNNWLHAWNGMNDSKHNVKPEP